MEVEASSAQKNPSRTRSVLIGSFLILLGLVLGYFFIYRKVEQMKLQADITYSMKGMLLVSFSIVFGIFYLIFTPAGAGAWKDLTAKEKPFFIGALVLSALVFAGLAYWFNTQLIAYGYNPLF